LGQIILPPVKEKTITPVIWTFKQHYETEYSVRIPLGGREGGTYVLGRCFASQHAMIFVAIGFI